MYIYSVTVSNVMEQVQCSNCGREFSASFKPSAGSVLLCGFCQLAQRDLTTSDLFVSLQAFLSTKLFAGKNGKITVAKDGMAYEVIAMPTKGTVALVGTAEAVPQNGANIPTNVPLAAALSKSAPMLLPLLVTFKAANAQMKALLTEFAKNYKDPSVTITVT
jgi:hypothetical protein